MKEASVLLVDDDRSVLEGLRLVLESLDFAVMLAESVDEAVQILEETTPTAIVSDEQMPGIVGSDLLVYVRNRHPEVIRVLLTGKSSVQSAQRAVQDGGAVSYLEKPCPGEVVANTLRRELLRRAMGSARKPEAGMTLGEAQEVLELVRAKRRL